MTVEEALSYVKILNEMEKTYLKALQKMVDPPLMVPDDGFINPVRTTPGGLNYYRTGLGRDERIFPLPMRMSPISTLILLLQPVLTIVWGVILLSEYPSIQQATGMVLILGSIIGVTVYGSVDSSSEKSKDTKVL